ncbi:MCP four helix bundle domain-containing protein [Flagellimonas halotolerans]|uniref:MCP four helix bundle domain-containing protein n=1 Tax=Flagellimonas halotolerans TaxID=3112164 RepID=A0ABU6ILB1_9FLAO|nr:MULTISPECIES: MCP four helix bundle domain-containing protein [unclassified Allomuricauda]MEC3963895.1 MCP four helix bundle domain-containing protein [Muricauda sp. SYSU M86414]MEC4263765.1 MCP four helix bundle domain-containing protein [Muricauda sp. SYSU M84420]
MPKKMSIKQRINAGFILAAAFILVLASNRLNQRNFSTVEQSVNSVFEDRLVVQEYIYRLNNLFHKKELALAKNELNTNMLAESSDIEKILSDFAKTELTVKESRYLSDLRSSYSELQEMEKNLSVKNASGSAEMKRDISSKLTRINNDLDELSEVQLSEGRQLTQRSQRSLGMNQLLSRLEIVFLVIIGILFLLIVFHREKRGMQLVEKDS